MRGLFLLVLVVPAIAVLGVLGLAFWPIGEPEPASFPAGDALNGAYLARASGCVACHSDTEAGGEAFAGGAPLDTPFGNFVPPNITPHSEAGIGRWTIQDFARAVRQGVSPEGKPYYPVFTYSFYASFTDQEISDLWTAFRTVPAVATPAERSRIKFPFRIRPGLKLWRAAYLDAPDVDALMGTSDAWNRGRLLVAGAAHCAACHTGRNLAGGLKESQAFAGNDKLPGGSKAPSIRAEDLAKRGWTVANLALALKSGILPDGDAFGGSMTEVVKQGTSYLADEDRLAIATYLMDPDGTGVPLEAEPQSGPIATNVDHSTMDMTREN